MIFIENQFTVNTADEKENYFTGEQQYNYKLNNEIESLPSGKYRIIDGELSKIISGVVLAELQNSIISQNQLD